MFKRSLLVLYFKILVSQQPNSGLVRPIFEVSISHNSRHTHTHIHTHTSSRYPLNGRSARYRGHYVHNTQQKQQTNIHVLSGIRTRDPTTQEAADQRLIPHGHQGVERILNYLH
jgi:hypothetical protein